MSTPTEAKKRPFRINLNNIDPKQQIGFNTLIVSIHRETLYFMLNCYCHEFRLRNCSYNYVFGILHFEYYYLLGIRSK